ncbi:unnamed protein product [Alopecurus aequalis]
MASSSSTGEEPPAPSVVAKAPPLPSTEAKMIVATGRDDCQQLKDMLSKEDHSSMVVVMASSHQTSTSPKPPSPSPPMDPRLLAVASSGSWKKLESFLRGDPRQRSTDGSIGISTVQQPPRDEEALLRESFLDGVTVEGDTFLHVVATNSVGENLIEDGLGLIHRKAVQFLTRQNNNGDTALHRAARMEKTQMVSFLLNLARRNGADAVKVLLKTENNSRWTVLHEAVRVGSNDMVELLMKEDRELARFPNDGTSPMYLAILLEEETIAKTLHKESYGVLSYSGPNGQNALHAAVLRGKDLTKMLLGWNSALTIQQDENGSTPFHFSASVLGQSAAQHTVRLHLLTANPDALYQPDHGGSFPIHVAASVDASYAIRDYIEYSPSCAGLRDARGRTFLHVAAGKKQKWTVVKNACMNRSLSWILNMQDNDGNTTLHLAVQLGSLIMFCALFANRKVHLNLTNGKGETPLDIACVNRARRDFGLKNAQNSEVRIHTALKIANAKSGICRQDDYEENDILQEGQDERRQMEMVKDSTENLIIGSALIATVAFGATFAMPGGYRADDHPNGGTPIRAGRYDFDAFTMANALAFTFSAIATTALMSSGSPSRNTRVRVMHYDVANYCMKISIRCLVAAFALGTYTMLAPVAHKTAIAVCAMSSLALLYQKLESILNHIVMIAPFCVRKGKIYTFNWFIFFIVRNILLGYWPMVVIFCSTLRSNPAGKVEPLSQPPTPSP